MSGRFPEKETRTSLNRLRRAQARLTEGPLLTRRLVKSKIDKYTVGTDTGNRHSRTGGGGTAPPREGPVKAHPGPSWAPRYPGTGGRWQTYKVTPVAGMAKSRNKKMCGAGGHPPTWQPRGILRGEPPRPGHSA